MLSEDEDLQPIAQEDLLLGPSFTLPEREVELEEVQELTPGGDELSSFDKRFRDPFTGLLFLGHLEETVAILGHKFRLVTPSQNERLETGILHKKYLNTISSEIGWAAITVAAYLHQVDGSDLPQPIGPASTGLTDRFSWVIENLKGPVISRVYEQCLLLDSKVNQAITELERLGES